MSLTPSMGEVLVPLVRRALFPVELHSSSAGLGYKKLRRFVSSLSVYRIDHLQLLKLIVIFPFFLPKTCPKIAGNESKLSVYTLP